MKEMIKRVREEKGGFTLAELLIVVAIILVLVAIAIPVFSGALGQAEDATRNAQIHSVKSAASTQILLNEEAYNVGTADEWTINATVAANGSVNISSITANGGGTEGATKDGSGVWTVIAVLEPTELPPVPTQP